MGWFILIFRVEKKTIITAVIPLMILFMSASFVPGQSLAEVAKKEKERRAALKAKGKTSIVVTNADLKRRHKLPTVSAKSDSSTAQRGLQPATTQASRSSSERSPQQEERLRDQGSGDFDNHKYATKVLPASELVKNPELALNRPDGKFAEMSLQGVLEIEINIQNGPGEDIAIYSRISGAQVTMPGGEEEGGIPETLGVDLHEGYWYGVMAINKYGEWEAIGRGRGGSDSEKFDLGSLSSTRKIRIIFKSLVVPDIPVKYVRSQSRELTCGIDAIEALH